jgi:hypothetical protein
MYGYVITKADPSNQEYVGRSVGNKQEILDSIHKVEFICLSQGDTGFVRGFYLDCSETSHILTPNQYISFEPLDYFQDELGFTSMFYLSPITGKWHEL